MVKERKKTRKSGLTASRKPEAQKAASAMRRPAESLTAIGCLDRLAQHCDEIAAVAGLMERCGEDPSAHATVTLGVWMNRKLSEIKVLAQAAWEAKR